MLATVYVCPACHCVSTIQICTCSDEETSGEDILKPTMLKQMVGITILYLTLKLKTMHTCNDFVFV